MKKTIIETLATIAIFSLLCYTTLELFIKFVEYIGGLEPW
jgi:hypothetical protein